MIKYRYALDDKDNLVDIIDIERTELTKNDRFFSLDFKQELIPRLGNINQKHFSQKPKKNILGNKETYLHALGKKVFLDEYSKCLQNKTSINIKYPVLKFCNRLEREFNITCRLEDEIRQFDLAAYFTEIRIEKKDNNFIPDLIIVNPKTKNKIYIEIAVTHRISGEKRNSGNRIIEFLLKNEEDANQIKQFISNEKCDLVSFYNFRPKKEINISCKKGSCNQKFIFFSVLDNGKCNLMILKEKDIQLKIENCKPNSIWFSLEVYVYQYYEEIYAEKKIFGALLLHNIAKAFEAKRIIRNCHICRYHSKNIDWMFKKEDTMFCKFHRVNCNSDSAVECKYYKIEQTYVYDYSKPPFSGE